MKTETPLYRAKKIDIDEYVVGTLIKVQNKSYIFEDNSSDIYLNSNINFDDGSIDGEIRIINSIYEFNPSTLAIHFPNMIDSNRNKVFASLSEGGIGGDEVEGYCRDCNGDEICIMHKPVNFKGVVRFYSETVMGVVVESEDEIIIPRKGCKPLVIKVGEPLRWSDCRQNIKVTGIK